MKRVFVLFGGKSNELGELTNTEILCKIDNIETWMPIQKQILKALNKEVKKGEIITVYCSFFNEHLNDNKLYNTFLISEFTK